MLMLKMNLPLNMNVKAILFLVNCLVISIFSHSSSSHSSNPCTWNSLAGAHFDLRRLILNSNSNFAYEIVDGDIPCTPQHEPSFGYIWNFCDNIPSSLLPEPCSLMGKSGVVLQYKDYGHNEYYCFIIGHYDKNIHDLKYNLLDPIDPSKGISITYPSGEKCSEAYPNTVRTATIDIECANVDHVVTSAQEPEVCHYHLAMKSYHGCPSECPITPGGLCNSHGHCAYDNKIKKTYCYCNEGWTGTTCSNKGSSSSNSNNSSTTYDGYSIQIGLLITLLLFALGLTGGVIYLAYEISEFRKQRIENHYNNLSGGENEMVETIKF